MSTQWTEADNTHAFGAAACTHQGEVAELKKQRDEHECGDTAAHFETMYLNMSGQNQEQELKIAELQEKLLQAQNENEVYRKSVIWPPDYERLQEQVGRLERENIRLRDQRDKAIANTEEALKVLRMWEGNI